MGRVATSAYLILVVVMVFAYVPWLRRQAVEWLRIQMWLWEMGRWEERWDELEPWKQEALIVRGRRILRRQEARP